MEILEAVFTMLEHAVLVFVSLCVFLIIKSLRSTVSCAVKIGYSSISEGVRNFFSTNYSNISLLTKEKWITVFVAISVICFTLISSPLIHEAIGLNNLALEKEGTHCYYVKINDYSNSHTLPASIRIEKDSVEYGEKSKTITRYYVEKVYFSDGKYLDFSDSDCVNVDEWSYMCDQNGQEWEVSLINEHAYSPYVQEKRSGNIIDTVLLVIELCVMVVVIISALSKNDQETDQISFHRPPTA